MKKLYRLNLDTLKDTPKAKEIRKKLLDGEKLDPENLYANEHQNLTVFESLCSQYWIIAALYKFLRLYIKARNFDKSLLTPVIILELHLEPAEFLNQSLLQEEINKEISKNLIHVFSPKIEGAIMVPSPANENEAVEEPTEEK